MQSTTIRMTLTGAHEGKTIKLNGFQFVNGQCEYTGAAHEVDGVSTYFTRCYQVKIDLPGIEKMSRPETKPNKRQADIIEAINATDKEDWVDKNGAVPHPRVKDVAELMDDPTVTKTEIIEVIEKWLS